MFGIATPSGVPSGVHRLDVGLRTGLGIGYLAICLAFGYSAEIILQLVMPAVIIFVSENAPIS